MGDKFEGSERDTTLAKVKEIEDWASSHPDAETEEYEAKQKELEAIFNPIMQKATKLLEELPEVCPEEWVECPEDSQDKANNPAKKDHQDQLLMKSIDL